MARNLVELFQSSATQHQDDPAMRYKRDGGWHTITYAGMQRFIEDLAGGLLALTAPDEEEAQNATWISQAQQASERPDPFGDIDPVTDIEGIGETYAAGPDELGIETTQDLWHEDPYEIGHALDTSPKRVKTWQRMAELMAISQIGPQYAELLVRSGVESILDLANENPDTLHERVQAKQDEIQPNIQGNTIGPGRIEQWINLAREHEPATPDTAQTAQPAADPFGDIDPVTDIEGIGDTYGQRLNDQGIETTQDLWHAATHETAHALDTSPKRVRSWQRMAELMAINGIGPQYAELLVRSGVESILDLAHADLDALHEKVQAKQDEIQPNIQGNTIRQPRVERWIQLAKTHTPNGAPSIDTDEVPLRGERVGIWSANSPEWVLTDYATLHCNAVTVPVYETLTPDQATYILNDCGARIVFVENEDKLEALLQNLDALDTVEHLVMMGPVPDGYQDKPMVLGMDELYARGRRFLDANEDILQTLADGIDPDDLASLVYTSGTTGDPKGVMLTHNNFASNVQATLDVLPIEGEVHLGFLPLAHSFARTGDEFVPYSSGSTVCFAEGVDQLGENMQEIKPSIVLSVPRLYEKMHDKVQQKVDDAGALKKRLFNWAIRVGKEYANKKADDETISPVLGAKHALADRLVLSSLRENVTGGNLKFFVSGGAALSPDIMQFFGATGLWIMQGYGLTETSPVLAANAPDAYRFGSVGRPLPGIDIRIDETVWDGPEGEGEIQVQGPNTTQGYWKLPDETEALFTEDDWLRTGDIGKFDDDGYLYITDRLKKIFKTAYGKYIVPNKIENKLTDRPLIAQAVIIGEDRKYVGALLAPDKESLLAWAQDQGIEETDPAKLIEMEAVQDAFWEQVEAVNEDLARYESVKQIQLLPRELDQDHDELTPTLKVKRRVVHENWGEKIDALYPDA